jgi:GTP cyclohydrolase III
LHELMPQQVSLEEAFMELTRDDVEFKTGVGPAATTEAAA